MVLAVEVPASVVAEAHRARLAVLPRVVEPGTDRLVAFMAVLVRASMVGMGLTVVTVQLEVVA